MNAVAWSETGHEHTTTLVSPRKISRVARKASSLARSIPELLPMLFLSTVSASSSLPLANNAVTKQAIAEETPFLSLAFLHSQAGLETAQRPCRTVLYLGTRSPNSRCRD